MSIILSKLNAAIAANQQSASAAPTASSTGESPIHGAATALSEALGKTVTVAGACLMVPAEVFVTSGLTVAENAVPGASHVLTGVRAAVENAERRIAKRSGEGWAAKLVGFDPDGCLVQFEMSRAAVP